MKIHIADKGTGFLLNIRRHKKEYKVIYFNHEWQEQGTSKIIVSCGLILTFAPVIATSMATMTKYTADGF